MPSQELLFFSANADRKFYFFWNIDGVKGLAFSRAGAPAHLAVSNGKALTPSRDQKFLKFSIRICRKKRALGWAVMARPCYTGGP